MAITDLSGNPDKIAELVTQGISKELENLIHKKLKEQVDPIVSKLARELADKTALATQAYIQHSGNSPTPSVQVHLSFNSKDIVYVAEEKAKF